jgi:hypothetical protein
VAGAPGGEVANIGERPAPVPSRRRSRGVHVGVHASSPTVLIANPSADVYGSDLQMLESVAGLRESGWRVVVVLPDRGPLVSRLLELGADVRRGET